MPVVLADSIIITSDDGNTEYVNMSTAGAVAIELFEMCKTKPADMTQVEMLEVRGLYRAFHDIKSHGSTGGVVSTLATADAKNIDGKFCKKVFRLVMLADKSASETAKLWASNAKSSAGY
eukprot:1604801-Pyramimonas_sp.AAC.1